MFILSRLTFAAIRIFGIPFYYAARILGASYQVIIPANTYAPWLKDKEFISLYRKVKKDSLVNFYQAWELWKLVEYCKEIPGDILEVGVWRGSTSIIMAKKLQLIRSEKRVYACDTFRGVVKAGFKEDNYYKGNEHNNTSRELVQNKFNTYNLKNVELLQGIFPEETGHLVADKTFGLCHIDVDTYQSAKDILLWVWDRTIPGGVIIFNDYGFPLTKGITKLVNEQSGKNDRLVFHNLNGNGILIKIK